MRGRRSKVAEGPASNISYDGIRLGWTVVVSLRQNCCKTGEGQRCHRNVDVKLPKFCSSIFVPPSETALLGDVAHLLSDDCRSCWPLEGTQPRAGEDRA